MTDYRFKKEISGELGDFWKRDAERRVANILKDYEDGKLIIDEYGVAYWSTNDRAIPDECAMYAEYAGLPINREFTREFEQEQTKRFLEEYRKERENHVYTEEELGEMRAEFGEGKVIVDVITGKRINTGYWKRR